MKLTAAQLELMTKVRDRMAADLESGFCHERKYICHNVVLIEHGLEDFDKALQFSDLADKEGSLSKGLLDSIDQAIDHNIAMEIYLEMLDINLDWNEIQQAYAPLACVAWLDRIVATGEIA